MKDNLFIKFIKFSYGSWLGIIVGLATTMIVTRILPVDAFAKASMFDLIIKIGLIFIVFGTDQSFIRFFYEEKEIKRGKLLLNCLKLPLIFFLILVFIFSIFKENILVFAFGEYQIHLYIIVVIGLFIQLIYRYAQLVIRMDQRANLYSIIQLLHKSLNLLIILAMFYLIGAVFEIMIVANVLTLIILSIFAIFFTRNFWSLKNFKVKNTKHTQLDIVKFGAPFVLTIFITWLFESFDKIALRYWSDFSELGYYAVAMKITALIMILRQTFSTFWSPVSYEKFEDTLINKEFFKSITTIVSFAMFFVAILTILFKDIIVLLLGQDYRIAADIMPFLVFMPVLYTISETTVIGINFYKKVKWHILIALAACILNISLNWAFVPTHGALGASFATALSFVLFFSLRTFISNYYFKVKYPLVKIYFMIVIIFIYAFLAIYLNTSSSTIILGLITLSFLLLVYYKALYQIFKKRKEIF